MKRIFTALFSFFSAFSIQAQPELNPHPISSDKIRLTEDQQLVGLPSSVIGGDAVPVSLEGNGKMIYRLGDSFYRYNASKGSSVACEYSQPAKVENFVFKVDGWVNPTYSPDSSKIAYTLDSDLYSTDVRTGKTVRLTFDGSDVILNGYASWVYYEEILGRASNYKAFWWSPDSRKLAYYRFDDSRVPMFPIYNSTGKHGFINETRYPKAGDRNPEVKIGFVSVDGGETLWADFDSERDQYFGIPFWNGEGTAFMVSQMSRSQDDIELFSVDPFSGHKESVYKEHQDSWTNRMGQMLFAKDGIYIIRDFTLWQQIYYLSYDGKTFRQLTEGNFWNISLLRANKDFLYFTARRDNTTRTDIFRLTLGSGKVDLLSDTGYSHSDVSVSDDMRDVVAYASNTHTPKKLVMYSFPRNHSISKMVMHTVHNPASPEFGNYAYASAEIVMLTMRDGVKLPALVVWPVDFDPSKKYPVKVFVYGGPDNPQVLDSWGKGGNQWWAYHGVIQVVLDNRASGHLGKRGMEGAYRRLGTIEVQDFIDGIKHFTSQPYVNPFKVGISGFSFGGTMTTLCVTEGSEWFKYGIAGGGVYDWALYDTHYTERYMDTPQNNPEGYDSSRVLDRLANYKGDSTNFLRITHGTGDDNVHFQQTLQLVDMLQKQGKDFELMIYPQAKHGYKQKQGVHSQMQDYVFWYKHLLDQPLPQKLYDYYKSLF